MGNLGPPWLHPSRCSVTSGLKNFVMWVANKKDNPQKKETEGKALLINRINNKNEAIHFVRAQ